MCNLGYCYEYGRGVAEDIEKAKEWFPKAAALGKSSAKARLDEAIIGRG